MGTTRSSRRRPSGLLAVLGACLLAGCTTSTAPPPGSSTSVTSSSAAPSTDTTTLGTISWPAGVVTPFRSTGAGSAAGKRFGLISPDATDPFSRAVTDSIITETTTAGASLIRCDPGADGEFALECAQRMANQQVDGWIVQHTGGELTSSLCAAGPKNVPMIVVDGQPGRCTTATVAADDGTAGEVAGSSLGAYSRRDHDCEFDSFILVTDPTEPAASAARAEGIRDGFRRSCPDRLVEPFVTTSPTTSTETSGGSSTGAPVTSTSPPPTEVPTTGTITTDPARQSAESSAAAAAARIQIIDTTDQKAVYDAVQRVIGGHPDSRHILIAAVSDGPAYTAMTAVRAAGRIDDVRLVAVGADQRSRCEIARNPRWLGDAALFPDRYGQLVIPSLIDAIAGRSVPQAMLIRSQFLDASTVRASYDVSTCPETS